MRHDLAANHVTLDDDVTLRLMQTGAPDTIATSRNAEIDLRPQRAMLRGTPVRVTREEDWLEAPSVAIARSAAGPSRMEATPEARARVTQRDAAGRAVGPSAFLAADAILLEEPAPSAEPTRPQNQTPGAAERTITLRGHARVEQPIARRAQDDSDRRAPDNPRPGPGIAAVPDAPGKTLSAGLITLTDRGDGKGRPFRATGAVVATMPAESPGGAPRTMQCRDLVGELGADAGLAFADATGGVRIDEGARKARGETARIEDSTRIALRGGRPSVSEPERTITADAIDADDGSHTLDARGAVRTQIKPRGAPAAAGSGPEVAGLFTTGAPIAIASDTALLKERDKTATFTGRVIARQEDRALSSDTLVVDDIAKSAKADGSVNLRTFRRESDPATSAPPAAGGGKLVPVHVTSDHLRHDDAARLTVFEGRAIYREPGRTLRADRITLRGAEAADSPSETLAQGHVVVEGDGKRGTGDEALHRARERTITISGSTTPAQVTEVASGRSWRGPSLTWSLTPDSIPVAAGSLGRSTITGAAPRPSRPKRDDQADRAIPR